jgi:hypothetical protein
VPSQLESAQSSFSQSKEGLLKQLSLLSFSYLVIPRSLDQASFVGVFALVRH